MQFMTIKRKYLLDQQLTFNWTVAILDIFLLEYNESQKKVADGIYTFYEHIWLLKTPKLNSKRIEVVTLNPKP